MPGPNQFIGTTFSIESVSGIGEANIRVRYTYDPKIIDSTANNDSLNPNNYVLVGPGTNYVTSVVAAPDDSQTVDLYLAAALTPGIWTVTVSNVISTVSVALTAPFSGAFDFELPAANTDVNGGALNNTSYEELRRFFHPAIKGKNTDALLSAFAYGDDIASQIAESSFDQGFLVSASGAYLDQRLSDIGLSRPAGVGMSDANARNMGVVIDNNKLTYNAILENLEVFYGEDTVKASVTCNNDEPYQLADGDELTVIFNNNDTKTILFDKTAFARIGEASAIEVATFINNRLINLNSTAKALAVLNTTTNKYRVEIISGKRGLASSVQIYGGRAQIVLDFPRSIFPDFGGTPYATWNISLSPTMVGNIVFSINSNDNYDFNQLLDGDLVYIYGTEFGLSNNVGSFAISNVNITYSGATITQTFEITNPNGLASSGLVQLYYNSLIFYRPIINTLYTQIRRVLVTKDKQGLNIIIPATTQIVSRTPQTGAYIKESNSLTLSSLINTSGTVTGISTTNHGLSLNDFFIIDDAVSNGTGRLSGLYKVFNIVNSTTFQYLVPDFITGTSTSGKLTKLAAKPAPVGVPGPFIYDRKKGIPITSIATTLTVQLQENQQYNIINVASTVGIPNSSGYLIFNFGFSTQVGPVKYTATVSTTEIIIDPSFVFNNSLPVGATVTLLAGRLPFVPAKNQFPGDFWLTNSASGRVAAEDTLDAIVAAGLNIRSTILYPNDRGLGGEGFPDINSSKLSSIVDDFAGDTIDAEIRKARGI